MKSGFYYEGHHRAVALAVRDYVNSSQDFLSLRTAGSPRAVGDAIEALVAEEFGERLARFYESDANVFSLLLIKYAVEGTSVDVSEVVFCPIEFLDWSCLTVGALGWGQIQIANANNIHVNENYSRKQWMLQMCDAKLEFYPKEIGKIQDRIEYFNGVRKSWETKEDLWH